MSSPALTYLFSASSVGLHGYRATIKSAPLTHNHLRESMLINVGIAPAGWCFENQHD
jgi:hypothetical protein